MLLFAKIQNILLDVAQDIWYEESLLQRIWPKHYRAGRSKKPRSTTKKFFLLSAVSRKYRFPGCLVGKEDRSVVEVNEDNISNQEQHGRQHQQKQRMRTSCVLAEQGDKMGRDRDHRAATKCRPRSGSLRILPLPQGALRFFPLKTIVMSSTC